MFYNPKDAEHDPVTHYSDSELTEHPEKPRRSKTILSAIKNGFKGVTWVECDREATDEELESVHSAQLVHFINNAWESLYRHSKKEDQELLVSAFPTLSHGVAHIPQALHLQTGHYCFDMSTPIAKNTARLARISAGIAIDSAKRVASSLDEPFRVLRYVLARPPGHHSTREKYGGYCYFNNIALAAQELSKYGKVAILDVDYHHGNGTQDIFYDREDVLFVSIHADPEYEYPWYSGTAEEIGINKGIHCNRNFPLPAETDWEEYKPAFLEAVDLITNFNPRVLLVALGVDTADGEPFCVFHLKPEDYHQMGTTIRNIGKPVFVFQEGGYSDDVTLGSCVSSFLRGLTQC
uniref:Histone deacetylase domain-containing protein n=1 Tax=Arcella intermedia TaxID=1963864 RepID=A0A6B2L8I3_9EUKA